MYYQTTVGRYRCGGKQTIQNSFEEEYEETTKPSADNPREPEGSGWELVNTTAADGLIFWTWRRA